MKSVFVGVATVHRQHPDMEQAPQGAKGVALIPDDAEVVGILTAENVVVWVQQVPHPNGTTWMHK